ncbi:hypothetical protein F5X99DRAFT_431145 [Biscogniauxia marginata]|nr:hypothetical protein F5X99DRAFT_431145 [Biscogniauxia marginata]
MDALAAESWTWYGLTWVIVGARMISRRVLFGSFLKLQTDDALMIFAMIADTVLIVTMNILSRTNTNLIDPNDTTPLTPESIQDRIFGSKMVLVVEQMQIVTIWTMKCCLLIMYNRLTMSLKQNVAVKIVVCYVAVGFVVMEILYLGVWCRPFDQYWAVPVANPQCSAATNHLITNAVLNISSDIMIILIPMPVFLKAQLPLRRKLILCGVFALGIFTVSPQIKHATSVFLLMILSAILNKYYSFMEPFGSNWTFWYIRESSTAIITANLPFTWTLLQRVFNLQSFIAKSTQRRTGDGPSRFRSTGYGAHHTMTTIIQGGDEEFPRSDSQERIHIPLQIYRKQEVHVHSSTVADHESSRSASTNISAARSLSR